MSNARRHRHALLHLTSLTLSTALLLGACSSERGTNTTNISADGGADSNGDADAGTSDDGADADAGSSDDGVILDVGNGDDGSESSDLGCRKIDFLFVIDNSGSMRSEQENLIAAFPGFIDAIATSLPAATDFHIGVTKSDDFGQKGISDAPPHPSDPCLNTWGGLVDRETVLDPFPGSWTGYGDSCNFSSGERWMVNNPNVATEFACAAGVGVRGDSLEEQAHAAVAALEDQTCNAGFVRDDALLVLVFITDEDDDWSEPDTGGAAARAQIFFDQIIAAKGGIETNIVTLLVSGGEPRWPDCEPLDLMGGTGAAESEMLTALATLFTNNGLASVCSPGYTESFAAVLDTIETACDEFIPPG
jgi:hypothetical protein